jgi:predicted ATPase
MLVDRVHLPPELVKLDYGLRRTDWPLTVPVVKALVGEGMRFRSPITFLVGENGSGKSTVVEAMAEAFGLDVRGGKINRKYQYKGHEPKSALGERLHLDYTSAGARLMGGARAQRHGWFLRAETALEIMSQVSGKPGYWDKNVTEMSHGEGFLTLFNSLFDRKGLYLMDEPESALSFSSCLQLVRTMHDLGQTGSQIVCATHSPILAATPGADIIEIGTYGFRYVDDWRDLELTDHWRRFMDRPEAYFRHLFAD